MVYTYNILTIIGLILILTRLIIIAYNPLQVRISSKTVEIPVYDFKYKPPGNYTEHKIINLLKKIYENQSIHDIPYRVELSIPEHVNNTVYTGCRIINKTLTIEIYSTAPNSNGAIIITVSKVINGEEHVIGNRTVRLKALSGKVHELYGTASPLSSGEGKEKLVDNNLLIEYSTDIPLGNITGNITVTISSDLTINTHLLALRVNSLCEYSYELKQPTLDITRSSKYLSIPSRVIVDYQWFNYGLILSTIGITVILIDIVITITWKRTHT